MRYREVQVGMKVEVVGCNLSRLPYEALPWIGTKGKVVQKISNRRTLYYYPIFVKFKGVGFSLPFNQRELRQVKKE